MQKQMILCTTLPDTTTRSKYEATAKIVDIRGVKHLLCDLYINKIKVARYALNPKEYGKYLYQENKWSTSMNYYSEIKYLGEYERHILGKFNVSDDTAKILKKYGIKKDKNRSYVELVYEKMRVIQNARDEKKYNEKLSVKKRLFDMLSPVSKEFVDWAKGLYDTTPLSLIYNRETRYRATVGCCRCGITVTVKTDSVSPNTQTIPTPRRGNSGTCQWCKTIGRYVPQGRYKQESIYKDCYLFECLPDKSLVVRYFELRLNEYDTGHNIDMLERARVFMNINEKSRTYWNHSWHGEKREFWHSYNATGKNSYHLGNGCIYPNYTQELKKSILSYADFKGYAYSSTYLNCIPGTDDYVDALSAYAYCPQIEYIHKTGYEKIVRHLVNTHGVTSIINKKAKNIPDMLKIKSSRINFLKSKKGELSYLEVLQFERKNSLNLSDEEIEWMKNMCSHYRFKEELQHLLEYMSFRKIYNRVSEYATKEYKGLWYNAWIAYRDCIDIREKFGDDLTNTVYLHPRSLKETHAELVAERERRRDSEHIANKMKEFNSIPKHYKRLKKRYGMSSNGYVFVPAKTAEEIIIEGRILHHCVGGDTYLRKHNKGETAIIFMRNESAPDIPYVTIEVRDTKIVQWYGAHDEKSNEEATLNAINDFKEHIAKKGMKSAQQNLQQDLLVAAV